MTTARSALPQRPLTRPLARIEWPTLVAAAALYGSFAAVTLNFAVLPWWLALPLGGYLVAWHGSLQHEVVHGHPTPWRGLNELLVFPSLWLYLPHRAYRATHLAHHHNEVLTLPGADPESYYLDPAEWTRRGPLARSLLRFHNCLLGRLFLGPLLAVATTARDAAADLLNGRLDWDAWWRHGLGVALVLTWALGVCGLAFWEYLVFFAGPGIALTLLRSFLEHQARAKVGERTVIVEAEAPLALMFFNNNLHSVHHAHPGAPWYRLPDIYRRQRAAYLAENGGYVFKGYREVAWRYLFTPKEPVGHPL